MLLSLSRLGDMEGATRCTFIQAATHARVDAVLSKRMSGEDDKLFPVSARANRQLEY